MTHFNEYTDSIPVVGIPQPSDTPASIRPATFGPSSPVHEISLSPVANFWPSRATPEPCGREDEIQSDQWSFAAIDYLFWSHCPMARISRINHNQKKETRCEDQNPFLAFLEGLEVQDITLAFRNPPKKKAAPLGSTHEVDSKQRPWQLRLNPPTLEGLKLQLHRFERHNSETSQAMPHLKNPFPYQTPKKNADLFRYNWDRLGPFRGCLIWTGTKERVALNITSPGKKRSQCTAQEPRWPHHAGRRRLKPVFWRTWSGPRILGLSLLFIHVYNNYIYI